MQITTDLETIYRTLLNDIILQSDDRTLNRYLYAAIQRLEILRKKHQQERPL